MLKQTNPNKKALWAREYRAKKLIENPNWYKERNEKEKEARKASRKKWSKKNKNKRDSYYLSETYGITLDDYFSILESQGGVCGICKTSIPGGNGKFHVDHCHRTGIVRGLLCFWCNTGLGQFKDSVPLMLEAIKYLQKPGDVPNAPPNPQAPA